MPTKEECKKMIFKCGIELGVSPKLISERLLSDLDKIDMMEGVMEIDALNAAVEVWSGNGMPDYAHGKTLSYEDEKRMQHKQKMLREDPKPKYRRPFADYRVSD